MRIKVEKADYELTYPNQIIQVLDFGPFAGRRIDLEQMQNEPSSRESRLSLKSWHLHLDSKC